MRCIRMTGSPRSIHRRERSAARSPQPGLAHELPRDRNVVEEPTLAARFSVRELRSLLFLKDGRVKATVVGIVPKDEIVRRLDALGA